MGDRKMWKRVGHFTTGGSSVFFNAGRTSRDEPSLGININGAGGYKSRIVLFDSMKLDFCKHLLEAVKDVFGFDYIAYLKAAGELTEAVVSAEDAHYMDTAEFEEEPEPVSSISVVPEPTEEVEITEGCEECGNPPASDGGDWRFAWHNDTHLSRCERCGKIYRSYEGS